MSPEELSNQFDTLFNNITSNQAPGLNEYEKSVFLTKAQDEILKNYFNPKGNKYQEGFDGNQKRQIDFSMLTKVATNTTSTYSYTATSVTDGHGATTYTRTGSSASQPYSYGQAYDANGQPIADHYVRISDTPVTSFTSARYDQRANSKGAVIPENVMMIINERVAVTRGSHSNVSLTVVPISFDEYDRLMSKPFKRPLKNQAWRLINNDTSNIADLVVGPNDVITGYTVRYIKRPNPIIVGDLDGLTINGIGTATPCELDPILHEEILQRAVELAKVAWTQTGQDNLNAVLQAGQRSE